MCRTLKKIESASNNRLSVALENFNNLAMRRSKIAELQLLVQLDPNGPHRADLRRFLLTPMAPILRDETTGAATVT